MDEDFLREYRTDPWTAAITNMVLDGWTMGYEAARREVEREASDHGIINRESPFAGLCIQMREQSYGDLRERAAKELFAAGREAEQKAVIAMAALNRERRYGSQLESPAPDLVRAVHEYLAAVDDDDRVATAETEAAKDRARAYLDFALAQKGGS